MIVLVSALVLGGCSGGAEAAGLVLALGRVQATSDTRVMVEYGAPARVRELVRREGDRFRSLEGYGFGTIAQHAKLIDGAVGVDPTRLDEALVAGQPPRWAGVLWGSYDVDAVDDRLGALGIDRVRDAGGTRWNSGDDLAIEFGDGPFSGVVATNEFNNVRTADGSFAYAPARQGIEWVTSAGDRTLADDDTVGPLARCLGDVVAAVIVASGQAAGARADGTEVACVAGARDDVTRALDGEVPSTQEPWADLLPGADVTQDGELVRITSAPTERPVGLVLRAMRTGDLRALA